MKQDIKLIVENRSSIPEYLDQLDSVFGDAISVLAYSMEEPDAYRIKSGDVVLTSAFSAADFPAFKKAQLKERTLIPVNLCLQRKSLLRLNAYPKGMGVLVVNVTRFMAEEVIVQLCQAGYGHLSFSPWYPGCTDCREDVALAVTPGEPGCVPPFVTECIDLGPRQIDIVTIIELAVKLQCEYVLKTKRFLDFFERQFNPSAGVSILVGQNQLLEQRLAALVQMFDQGLIGIGANNLVFDCNFQAAEQLKRTRADVLHHGAEEFLEKELLDRCATQQLPVTKQWGDSGYAVELTPITRGVEYMGAFATLGPAEADSRPALSNPATGKGHVAKYRFADICGSSHCLLQTIELAKKMARTDSSILITGESGTGKELFAHAIHNSSVRARCPFVAINCAALPDSLLESELFGYEEGAFTGAKRGGRRGLFELANTGSIFLDEIEGMAASTQLKLLRVIQEREMMRVGGDRVIPIDVRIISASNQELMPLIESGKFRRDLFYRVSTLPLNLPPLRRRKEDIPMLMEQFKSTLHLTFVLTVEAKAMLLRYSWPGNIRELRNCVEYLGCQSLPVIEPENLPYTICGPGRDSGLESLDPQRLQRELLGALASGPRGRKQLQRLLGQTGLDVTESQLRKELERLKALDLVTSDAGRVGSRLTEAGLLEYKNGR